jgi:hypothetical protein
VGIDDVVANFELDERQGLSSLEILQVLFR